MRWSISFFDVEYQKAFCPMTRRHQLILLTILGVLALQFVVPAALLSESGANRWAWQMYSRQTDRPDIVAILEDGDREPVKISDHLAGFRSELRLDARTLDRLCSRIPGVESFELTRESSGEEAVHQCNG